MMKVHDSAPILVSGVYRSGTTFLAAMLGAHPNLVATSSTVKFLRFCYDRYGDLSEPEKLRALVDDTQKRIRVRWNIDLDVEAVLENLERLDDTSYARVYDVIMKKLLVGSSDDVRWVEKLAMQWSDIPLFLEMFPNGKVIHIVRDPRDVTASYKAMTFESGFTFLDAAFNCRSSMQDAIRYRDSLSDGFLLVRAEDVADEPERWARTICEFLELDYDRRMLNTKHFEAAGEDWSTNSSFDQSFESIKRVAPRWPEHLAREELMLVELVTQPFLTQYGYQHSGAVPSQSEWQQLYELCSDDFLRRRFERWIVEGKGSQGYRTDPYMHEMRLVFPERFQAVEG